MRVCRPNRKGHVELICASMVIEVALLQWLNCQEIILNRECKNIFMSNTISNYFHSIEKFSFEVVTKESTIIPRHSAHANH